MFQKMTVTPTMAKNWLDKNVSNRAKSDPRIKLYAELMSDDKWKLNGESLKFDRNGNLLDGQHRLEAIVLSGKPIETYVVDGLDPDVFTTLDQGIHRGLRHHLDCMGERNTVMLSASLCWLAAYVNHWEHPRSICFSEALELLAAYPHIRDAFGPLGALIHQTKGFIRPAIVVALHTIFSEIDATMSLDLLSKFVRGEMLGAKDPATSGFFFLRKRMLGEEKKLRKSEWGLIFILAIKAWNLARQKRVVSNLSFRTDGDRKEPYPVAC